jgi:hypothetical protein
MCSDELVFADLVSHFLYCFKYTGRQEPSRGEQMTSTASSAAAASPTRPWPADRVEQWPIDRLTPYANNPRLHSAADIERIAASILKWGWTNPVLVDEQGVLIAGHGRVAAAAKLGLTIPIPVIVARGWSDEEKQAYRLADNELAARGSWDPDLLRSELRDLKFTGFDLDLIGFEPDRLEEILAGLGSSGLSDPDSVPDVPDQPVTGPGDVWLLGDHRVGCGDSTNAANVEPVLAGSQPHLMVSDPPYGVGYDPSWRAPWGRFRQARAGQSDQRRPRRLAAGLCVVFRGCRLCVARGRCTVTWSAAI